MAFSISRTAQSMRIWWLTTLLISINIAVFLSESILGVSMLAPSMRDLLHWGANFAPLTLTGDPWRLLSNMFLHVGIIHLLMNCWALYVFGIYSEFYYGRRFYLALYLTTGLMASLTSLVYHYNSLAQIIAGAALTVSAGASGAIMGLGGALIIAAWRPRASIAPDQSLNLNQLLLIMAINIGLGLSIEGIDNAAHVGGLLTGVLLAWVYAYTDQARPALQRTIRVGTFCAIALFGSIVFQHIEAHATDLKPLRAAFLAQIPPSP